MKKIITLLSFCLCAGMLTAQEPALKVASDGDVGIGDGNPNARLVIKNNASSIGATLRFRSNNTSALFNYFDAGTDGLSSQWNVDLNPDKEDGLVSLGYFRSTNTTGNAGFIIFQANNTPNVNTYLGANRDSYFNNVAGNVLMGTNSQLSAGNKLQVNGNAYKNAGGSNWAVPSDRNLKRNIKSFSSGLEVLKKMNIVEYDYNGKSGTVDGEHAIGVVAQELKKIAPYMVNKAVYQETTMDENGLTEVVNEEEILTVNSSPVKWLLVNAVQEQQEMIDELKSENDELREMMNELIEKIEAGQVSQTTEATLQGSADQASLQQNTPNPFNGMTEMKYFVPSNASSAKIIITSVSGQVLKTVNIANTGAGVLELNSSDIPQGNYHYTLTVDGNVVDTKTMTLVR